jgi:hypothetical protein
MLGAPVPIASCSALPPAVVRDAHRPRLTCKHKICLIRQTIRTHVLVIANRSANRSPLARVLLVRRKRDARMGKMFLAISSQQRLDN